MVVQGMLKAGDRIRLLDEVGEGTLVEIKGRKAVVDIDGFVYDLPLNKVVKVEHDDLVRPAQITPKDHSEKLRQVQQQSAVRQQSDSARTVYELDLHIEELTDRYHHMNNGEILELQMRCCRQFIREAYDKRYRKVVLIHGRGEGVLKMEIHRYLDRFPNVEYYDAPYRTYGYGATEVVIHR